ncbi:MAG: hypothetical protein LUF30_10450 [Lachnospiraceae bacterium]|nr:hypothetical protein [Lachnospiraceae bacterium]
MTYDDRLRFSKLNAAAAKKLGRSVLLRPDWEQIKVTEVRNLIPGEISLRENSLLFQKNIR